MNNKILYLGPKGTYCELAKNKIFTMDASEGCELRSIKMIIDEVDRSNNLIAVIPIENSIEGIVRETIDNLIRVNDERTKIIAEIYLDINHCLISKSKDIATIKNIISHPQAIAQCNNFIIDNFGAAIELHHATSTAYAVSQLSSKDETWAAIANERTAELYGLNIIQTKINDEKDNQTRFVAIAKTPAKPTGKDKTSIAFSVKNKPGSLVNILNIFNEHSINMSYIDSRPSRKVFGEYTFYIDFDGHIDDPLVSEAIKKIKTNTTFFRHNGSFPKA